MQLTANQKRVLATLQQSGKPLSAYKILESLKGDGFTAPIQIYRALGRLTKEGMVHRLESLNAYVKCDPPLACEGVRAFAICDRCGHVDEFHIPSFNHCLDTWLKQSLFALDNSIVELHGTCTTCCDRALKKKATPSRYPHREPCK
ncbi:transcriptional repressor [Pantoea sp. Tr-811]|uniref:Fur family transcriptional regulator n=1 Tax=unclassified Pantoea TaxID=2630326 RepID=UPI00141DD7C9|nr:MULTISPECIES: Fur family transcriptional regulator [unclassified Pantoea]NIE73532.1 transcriptional repressor [Pantoea sp. Ap-967]NIF27499.1 transcriptional repressor [Pantoea sp. Tr-811]